MHLISEKFSVPQVAPHGPRPRLLSLLERGVELYAATVLCGRAGTGKTLLAADFARRCGRAVAWYRVDAADNQPGIFFQYLLESVRRQRPALRREAGQELREMMAPEEMPRLAAALAFELQESGGAPLLLVIEDLHLVYDEDWVAPFFSRFIPLLPADVHVFIIARSVPPGPLWRLRSKQQLSVVDEQYLAFTLEEARELFASYGLDRGAAAKQLVYTYGRAALLDEIARERRAAASDSAGGQALAGLGVCVPTA
jgi:LuxR family transcriptional regulator, maltose regulon positive regulatory protein